jgi:glycine/D-amino acid oxidase-like deaminating enzyme
MSSVVRLRRPHRLDPDDRSLWLEQAGAAQPPSAPQAALPRRCDVCVVGGGMTGLWTAIWVKLADPSIHVVLLEAGVCGGAASGRNGGFVMTAWSKFGALQRLCGTADALAYARATERAVGEIGGFCAEHGIDAEFHQGGWLWTATNRAQLDAWSYTMDQLAGAGEAPYRILEPDEVARRSGSAVHLAGVFESAPATVHPARLTRGLAEVACRLDVTIVEGCAVHKVASPGTPRLVTDLGEMAADHVVLAISAWAAGVPEAQGSLVVLASDVIATEPAPERISSTGFPLGLSVSDSRRLVNYYRTTEDGRVVFGKGGGGIAVGGRITRSFDRSGRHAAEVLAQFRRTYPALADLPVPARWRGAVDYSVTGVPFVGPLSRDGHVFLAAGFSGNGVGPSFVAGRALADMALGREAPELPEGLRAPRASRLPPEPVRALAGRLVRAAVKRKEDAEDQGRTPAGPLRAIASLDPTSFTDKGPKQPVG